jgi:hypothetical protein
MVARDDSAPPKTRVLVLGREGLGQGDDDLGVALLRQFLQALLTNPLRPDKIVCWNAGVKLLAADAPTVGILQDLEGVGVEILVSRACVERFGLPEKIRAGELSTMSAIVGLLLRSDVLAV